MHIGILGAGHIGGTLTRKLRRLGHAVSVANSRGPESLKALAAETGATAVSVADVVKGVELVVVTIPEKSVPLLPKGLFRGVADEVVVVDTGNYYPSFRDGPIDDIEHGMAESRWVARQLDRPVLKAFNNIMWLSLADGSLPPGTPTRIGVPVAGDDARAKKAVMDLIDTLGFDPVDGGSLDESWRQQPGTPVYCTDLDADGVRRALARADRTRAPEMRELSIQKMGQLPKGASHKDTIWLVRSLF